MPIRVQSAMRRRIHACHMRRRIHACHMRRRIHAYTRAKRDDACLRRLLDQEPAQFSWVSSMPRPPVQR